MGQRKSPLRSVTPLHRSYWAELLNNQLQKRVSPRANCEAVNAEARYLDGNDSLEDQVEGDLGPHGDLLAQGDLDGDAEHCPVLNEDWERFDADHVKSEGLSAAICNKEYLSTCHKTWSAVQFFCL